MGWVCSPVSLFVPFRHSICRPACLFFQCMHSLTSLSLPSSDLHLFLAQFACRYVGYPLPYNCCCSFRDTCIQEPRRPCSVFNAVILKASIARAMYHSNTCGLWLTFTDTVLHWLSCRTYGRIHAKTKK